MRVRRTIAPQLTAERMRNTAANRKLLGGMSTGTWALQNATFVGSGALGAGDRGAFQEIPMYTGNPYDSNNYVFRWRQYVHLYEISWEARKIIRIPVEDALRKPWIAEGANEEMTSAIQQKLNKLNFIHVLSRSLMLERLLGGSLSFLGLESNEDDADAPYDPKEGAKLAFCNAIPISRIARMTWDTNPLSENYMRPIKYLINGEGVHVSRCLVWDGEPLFDPYDFALTNFRSNLAGFGPSKLSPIWDDIVKAVGTRQAAYQLIQVNNAIIAAVSGLQDLQSTMGGQMTLVKLKEMANSLSVYRAALIDGDRVNITQSPASFSSIPELIITFIQILSAASDIPATRFLGQAPGGLNATGTSDLENYYNVIDSYQRLRIEPALRRIYDIIGYSMFKDRWTAEREKLEFKFPPLWNLTEIQEAERASKIIDNLVKVRDSSMIADEKFIDELNKKQIFSVQLDDTDIGVINDTELGGGDGEGGEFGAGDGKGKDAGESAGVDKNRPPGMGSAEQQIKRLRTPNSYYVKNADAISLLIKTAGGDPDTVDREQFIKGLSTEQEHFNTTHGDESTIAKIVLDHLNERHDYYIKLEQYVENVAAYFENFIEKRGDKWVVLSHDKSKTLGEYGSKAAAEKRLKQIEYFKHVQNDHNENSIYLERLPQPTEAQKQAGNYKKHHVKVHGLKISIENPMGSERTGTGKDGKKWSSILPAHYGYVRPSEGKDGQQVDAFVGPHEDSELVFVVDQVDPDTKAFDEHKAIFGALSLTQAKELYLKGFSDGKGESRVGAIAPVLIGDFKKWLKDGDTKKPFSPLG